MTGNVSGISASMVGLGNVNNTSDLNKPISTATQTALNLKVDLSGNNVWTGTNSFNTSLPTSTQTPTTSSQLITKAYADTKADLSGNNSFTGTNNFSSLSINGKVFPSNLGSYILYTSIIESETALPNSGVSGINYYTFTSLPIGVYMLTSGISVRAFTYPDTTYIHISASFTSSTLTVPNQLSTFFTSNTSNTYQQFNYCTTISNSSASNSLYVVVSRDGGAGTFKTFTNIAWINLVRIA